MPTLVRKAIIFAAVEGLILQPTAQRNQRPAASVRIDYEKHDLQPFSGDVHAQSEPGEDDSLEVFGVIGLLKFTTSAYLVSVSKRKQVAQIWGKPIYVITGVSIIPLCSQSEARRAIQHSRREVTFSEEDSEGTSESSDDASDDLDDSFSAGDTCLIEKGDARRPSRPESEGIGRGAAGGRRQPGIVEEVFGKKGGYGRYADWWFSRKGWTTEQLGIQNGRRASDASLQEGKRSDSTVGPNDNGDTAEAPEGSNSVQLSQTLELEEMLGEASTSSITESSPLLSKLVRTTRLLLNSRTFFYSYDLDITRRLPNRQASSDVPLHRQVDLEYYWNHHLSTPFLDAGLHEYAIPIMQGFVGQRAFCLQVQPAPPITLEGTDHVPEATTAVESPLDAQKMINQQDFLITLISRRSTQRSGLRYLRRGIDKDGNVANAVETEQILSSPTWDAARKIYSFVQTRGSIPLFYSQMPYTFKPPPKLHASLEINQKALEMHFAGLVARYGQVQAISLVDRHGGEFDIGNAYERTVSKINNGNPNGPNPINFTWFDFHHVCKGMKFQNVSILIDAVARSLESYGFTTIETSQTRSTQTGIIRTNCMDCLDRTNVVQSAIAQHMLSLELQSSGISIDLAADPSTMWFNTLWADNGDAISRAYTGTSALKGDYTRTRKRNAFGAIKDLSLTLTRYYHNFFDDFFTQAAIDYLLGTVSESVFSEFESTMMTADPALDLTKARQSAINASVLLIVEEGEDLLHGWTLLVPAVRNTLRTFPFTEALLLLTEKAIYLVDYDWDASKVSSFKRIELRRIVGLQYGVYVTETQTPSQRDLARNIGLLIQYRTFEPYRESTGPRVPSNTRSPENDITGAWPKSGECGRDESGSEAGAAEAILGNNDDGHEPCFLAFKALPATSVGLDVGGKGRQGKSFREIDIVRQICEELKVAKEKLESGSRGQSEVLVVEEKDVLSLEEAKKKTGLVEGIKWSVKKAIWGWI